MKRRALLPRAISLTALLVLRASSASACQTGSTTITELPPIDGQYQVFAMNPAGDLTGFFFTSQQLNSHAFSYHDSALVDLGTLGGSSSEGHAINASGQIVGEADLTGNSQSHAFLRSNGALLDLGTLGGPSSSATAINDQGVIAGNSDLPGGAGTASFIVANGVMASLGSLGSNYSSAIAINNNRLVVGQAGVAPGAVHAFSFLNGTLADLGTLGGTYSSAFAVNDSGLIVGESFLGNGDTHGFVFANGVMTDVGTFGGTYASAYLVNSNGVVAGVANITDDLEMHGFVYSGGALTDLGILDGDLLVVPNAINNLDQVVGTAYTETFMEHAFIWEKGKLRDLNDLLPANSGWDLVMALFINDAGRIVGVGNHGGIQEWFILDLAGANRAPVTVAGPDQAVDCGSHVTLDGSGSSDPDNDSLTFEWSLGGLVLGTTAQLSTSLPFGANVLTLKVTDPCGLSSQENVTVVVSDTTPPNGSCPAAVTASANANCQAAVPDLASEVVATDNCTPAQSLQIAQSPAAGTLVGLGPHTVNITVTDASGNASTCGVLFTVNDTTPPAIVSVPEQLAIPAAAGCQAQVPNVLGSVTATDSCTPVNQLVMTQNPAAGSLIGVGTHTIVVTVKDAAGNSTSANVLFRVADTGTPVIQSVVATPNVLTPPNHQLVPVSVSARVADTCDAAPVTKIISITCSEPTVAGDIRITGDLCAMLAAAKNSSGATRVYTITVQATDASGNSSTGLVTVTVPKSNGNSGVAAEISRRH